MSKIPIKVKIALRILKKYCEKQVICENCIFHTYNTKVYNPGHCDLEYRNPYANYNYYCKRRNRNNV